MAYVKTEWHNGDPITEDKLNNIEDGIKDLEENGGGVLIVNIVPVENQESSNSGR